jgi:thymidine phosphorylase
LGAGVELHAVQGEQVRAGQPLMTLFSDEQSRFDRALESREGGIKISDVAPTERKLLLGRVTE